MLYYTNRHLTYLFILSFLAVMFASSCNRSKRIININPDFSINVGKPSRSFPGGGELDPAKREIYEQYGKPDFIRLWWSEDGRLHRYLEVDRILKDRRIVYKLKHSWIYLGENIECIIDNEDSYREIPLSDKIRAICTYGDPENVKKMSDDDLPLKETWNYYSIGLILKFENDKQVGQQRHPAMGNVILH